MPEVATFIFYIVVVVFSVVIHELSHGYVARFLGDRTAEDAGRLTLNPIAHLDPIGSVIFPLLMHFAGLPGLAWAKPVPYNPLNLYRDFKYGPLKVALAGPASNLLLMLVFGLLARFTTDLLPLPAVAGLAFIGFVNAFLAVFNLVPVPPLDGSKILPLILPARYGDAIERIGLGGLAIVFLFIYFFSGVIARIAVALYMGVAGGEAMRYVNLVF